MNKSRIIWLKTFYHNRLLSRGFSKKINHYNNLNIKSSATHQEIKSAYFKLSKQYHPDMNSSEHAKVKFNEISLAYEVLGNHAKRKQYDRGLQISVYDQSNIPPRKVNITDIAEEAKRVHAALNRNCGDNQSKFNFDEWAEKHYGKVFERRQKELQKYKSFVNERNEENKRGISRRNEISMLFSFISIIFLILCYKLQAWDDIDVPKHLYNEDEIIENTPKIPTNKS